MKWFRFYHEFVDDPKIAMMSDSDQLLWVKALCLASESNERGFILLSDEEICWKLRVTIEVWKHAIDKFRAKGMIEHCKQGYQIANWDKRQYESDTSASRTRRYREKLKTSGKKRVRDNVVTSQKQSGDNFVTPPDTDTEQITEKESLNTSLVDIEIGDSVESQHASQPVEFGGSGDDVCPELIDISCEGDVIQGELVATEQATRQGECSAPAKKTRSKKNVSLVASEFQDFQIAYNELKPAMWAVMEVLTPKRCEILSGLVREVGDRTYALEVFKNALCYASQDEWCRVRNLSFENFKSNNKIIQFHERWIASAGRAKGVSLSPENAKHLNTMYNYAKLLESSND